MKSKPRYRARTEYYGVELFDRYEGRVIPLDNSSSEILSKLSLSPEDEDHVSQSDQLSNVPELFINGRWNVEPVIDTPYQKTSKYASAPRRIYWELTRKCNLNCQSCFNRSFADQEELSTEAVLKLAEQFYEAGVYEIRCTGGEPTLRPDFFEIVQELKNTGFYISMGTNGVYSKEVMSELLKAPVDWIIISLDGASESSHAEMRGEGYFRKTINSLERLSSKGCRIRLNTLIRKTNYTYKHLKGLAALCDEYSIESLNCIPLRPFTYSPKTLKLQLSAAEFREFIKGLNQLRKEHRTEFVTTLDLRHTDSHDRIYFKARSCAAGREGAVVSPYGEIYGCSYSPASLPNESKEKRNLYVAGNIVKDNFLSVWNRSHRWAIYRDLDKYKHEKCKACDYYVSKRCIGNCPIMDENDPAAFDPYCYLHVEDR